MTLKEQVMLFSKLKIVLQIVSSGILGFVKYKCAIFGFYCLSRCLVIFIVQSSELTKNLEAIIICYIDLKRNRSDIDQINHFVDVQQAQS